MSLCGHLDLLRGKTGSLPEVMIFNWYTSSHTTAANDLQRVFNYNTQERVVSFEAHPEYNLSSPILILVTFDVSLFIPPNLLSSLGPTI